MADGSIIIDTRIDTGGVSKGMNAVKAGMARIKACWFCYQEHGFGNEKSCREHVQSEQADGPVENEPFPDAGNVIVVFRGIPGDKRCQ